jgi:hypothetical protein
MNESFIFLFSTILVAFVFLLVYNYFSDYNDYEEIILMTEELQKLKNNIDYQCSNNFINEFFEFNYMGGQEIYYLNNKICSYVDEQLIGCVKINCKLLNDNILFDRINISKKFMCSIRNADNNLLNLTCI